MNLSSLQLELTMIAQQLHALRLRPVLKDVTKMECIMLEQLHHHKASNPDAEGMYVSSLADRLHTAPPAISRMLKSTERKGYTERSVDQNDRRNTYIRITPEGEAACARAKATMNRVIATVIDEMGPDDMQQLISLFKQFVNTMESTIQNLDKGEQECSKFSNT